MSAHQFAFQHISGGELALSDFSGGAVLIVNTASQCGFTPQYRDLQGLWERYGDKGLTVIGVPSNDFGAQEPGTEAEIVSFCEVNYSVSFPMVSKQVVLGAEAHPFYKWVVAEAGEGAAPKWNFHKYLIGPSGNLAGAFPSKVGPLDAALLAEIDKVLA
ncbi:hydroperoxy fatty acid reductase gpx1 [Rhodobiaceae bacterium]|nr:hydroperoxy fatty acid reductase gpx1 [Rhodobiaceae bacterium]